MSQEPVHIPLTLKGYIYDRGYDDRSHALEDIQGKTMTHGELRGCIRATLANLQRAGFSRGDRLATVFSPGAEEGAALIALASGFTLLPVNPAFNEEEFRRYLSEARAKAMVVEKGTSDTARKVGRDLGIEILDFARESRGDSLGFSIGGSVGGEGAEPEFSLEGDVLFVIGTSGTTAKPKLVPLTQSNFCWSMHFYNLSFQTNSTDRYLLFMPLFHAHGIFPLIRVIGMGGCAVCTPSFDPLRFYEWLDGSRATLVTAGPSNYQALLDHAKENLEVIKRNRLRCISTGNAAMPVTVMKELERLFMAPVIESYGMTESIAITSNPLPPGKAKHGSAGISWGVEVAVLDDDGTILPDGKIGEVAVRGDQMTAGYENDPEANGRAFKNGWFMTGDVGFFDEEKYLYIKGRLKELINRGGEKIAPREVEEVLLEHPAVKEAVVFSIPHPKLGEDVGAAVVTRGEGTVSEAELRVYVSGRLAFFKVPSRVLILAELPKGATGKLTRIGMAERLGLAAVKPFGEYVPPRTETERKLAELLGRIFAVDRVGIKDSFFDLGGHSLMAVRLFSEIEKEFGVKLPLSTLFQYPTVEGIAECLGEEGKQKGWTTLVPLQTCGLEPPLFLVHGGDGDVINYKELVKALGEGRRIFGIQAKGLDGREAPLESFEEMGRRYIEDIKTVQPDGPYYIAGFSAGGIIAFEMARLLEAKGERAAFVGIIDVDALRFDERFLRRNARRVFLRELLFLSKDIMPNSPRRRAGMDLKLWLRVKTMARVGAKGLGIGSMGVGDLVPGDAVILPEPRKGVYLAQIRAAGQYVPREYGGVVTVFRGEGIPFVYPSVEESGWEMYAKGGVDLHVVPGRIHGSQLKSPNVQYLAKRMRESMDSAGSAR